MHFGIPPWLRYIALQTVRGRFPYLVKSLEESFRFPINIILLLQIPQLMWLYRNVRAPYIGFYWAGNHAYPTRDSTQIVVKGTELGRDCVACKGFAIHCNVREIAMTKMFLGTPRASRIVGIGGYGWVASTWV